MSGSKRLAALFLAGALIVGALVGYAGAHVLEVRTAQAETRSSLRDRLGTALELSDGQRLTLDSILDRRHRDMTAAFAPVKPAMDSIRERARDEIRAMLDGGQRAAFEQYLADQAARNEEKKKAAGSQR